MQTGVIGDPAADPGSTGLLTYERLATIAEAKGLGESPWQVFLRAVGCNWLVCLAVRLASAAETVSGEILAIFFPIVAFVAIGVDHIVANVRGVVLLVPVPAGPAVGSGDRTAAAEPEATAQRR